MKKHFDFVFLFPGNNFSKEFVHSWTNTVSFLERNGFSYYYLFQYSPLLPYLRNSMIIHDIENTQVVERPNFTPSRNSKPFAGKISCTKVIFIDSDIIWTLDDIQKLLFFDADIVSGLYPFDDDVSVSVKIKKDDDTFLLKKDLHLFDQPFYHETGGIGFTAVRQNVLEKIKYPWFSLTQKEEVTSEGLLRYTHEGEDFFFFRRALEEGFLPIADPSILLGHKKEKILRIN
jgi:hypothetical protein